MKKISKEKILAILMLVVLVVFLTSFSSSSSAASPTAQVSSTEVWSEGVIDNTAVTSQLIQNVTSGNTVKLVFRLINTQEEWAEVSWNMGMENAAIINMVYSEFPSMYKAAVPIKNGQSEIIMPPGARGIVIITIMTNQGSSSIKVTFSLGISVKLSSELEKVLTEIRESAAPKDPFL